MYYPKQTTGFYIRHNIKQCCLTPKGCFKFPLEKKKYLLCTISPSFKNSIPSSNPGTPLYQTRWQIPVWEINNQMAFEVSHSAIILMWLCEINTKICESWRTCINTVWFIYNTEQDIADYNFRISSQITKEFTLWPTCKQCLALPSVSAFCRLSDLKYTRTLAWSHPSQTRNIV